MFSDRVSLCRLHWPWTWNLSASASWVLGSLAAPPCSACYNPTCWDSIVPSWLVGLFHTGASVLLLGPSWSLRAFLLSDTIKCSVSSTPCLTPGLAISARNTCAIQVGVWHVETKILLRNSLVFSSKSHKVPPLRAVRQKRMERVSWGCIGSLPWGAGFILGLADGTVHGRGEPHWGFPKQVAHWSQWVAQWLRKQLCWQL